MKEKTKIEEEMHEHQLRQFIIDKYFGEAHRLGLERFWKEYPSFWSRLINQEKADVFIQEEMNNIILRELTK